MNELIIEYMKKLEKHALHKGEKYRAVAFKKTMKAVSSLDFEIKDIKALKGKAGLGKGMLDRIKEILDTKRLKEADEIAGNEKDTVMERFMKIHGVGQVTAERWYKKGRKTLDDLLKNEELTHAQSIGIKYYDEINRKIPRKLIDEMEEIIQMAKDELNDHLGIKLECVIAGSYRRGLKESGDIDCLVSENNSNLPDAHIDAFLDSLKEKGFVTDELGRGENKFMGICVDSKGIHRRIDFEFCRDYNAFPYELLYFTGSQTLNIEMRQKAKDQNMVLSQKGLFKNKVFIPVSDEKEIFLKLGMKYLKSEERNL